MDKRIFFGRCNIYLQQIPIDNIGEDFNYDLLKVSENKLLDAFTHHVQMVNQSPHISGSLIDRVYINKTLMEEFSTNVSVENICSTDHDALRTVIEKNLVGFQMISQNPI